MKKKKTLVTPFTIGTWNVRTLMDSSKADRPERRTALVARELDRYNIHIAALSETRLANEGQLTEAKAGYTFFWSGRSSEERREAGVGFAIRSNLVSKLTSLPKGLNDRLMHMRVPLKGKCHTTIISAYAPTMTNPEETKERFYADLEVLIASVPKEDKLIILGDFNARVGTDCQAWEGVIGKNGIGKSNSNGHLLLRTCSAHDLLITNTVFRLPNRNKTSWMHPRSKHWHLIDYIIVRRRDMKDVQVTKAMCGAECWTDHRLILSKLNMHIHPRRRPQGKKANKRLNISKLEQNSVRDNLSEDLDSKLRLLDLDLDRTDENWVALRDIVYNTALTHLGQNMRKHQDWFDDNNEEIQKLLDEKHQAYRVFQQDKSSESKKAAFNSSKGKVQAKLREMQDSWLSTKADEIQKYADSNHSKRFYDALKTIYGPQTSGTSPLLSADGSTLFTEKNAILKRWAEHFNNVLNRPSCINDEAIARMPQVDINASLAEPPTEPEVQKAIRLLSNGKAPGSDSIPAEIYKAGGPVLLRKLTELFQTMWQQEAIPQELKDASIVHLYKRKGNRRSCDNHRGISLLVIAGKILARVLLNRLTHHMEDGHLPESQCGFRQGRGTVDMIFAARQLQEKFQEQHRDLYTTFVDLTKAFDTVSREGLWKIMGKFGCPDKFISMVRQFHDGMHARVLDDGDSSNVFPVTNGVKQGCVLAPTLFSMVFAAMLSDAFSDNDMSSIKIRFRTDGKLFNHRNLHAITKVGEDSVCDLLFADDCALNAATKDHMQQNMNSFSTACNNFGLTISTKKTEVLHQPAPHKTYVEPAITTGGETLKAVDKFTYLGSTLSRFVNIDEEVDTRIAKASSVFGRLRKSVWERRGIKLATKLKVYRAVVLPTLLYACETWTVYERHARKLDRFHMNSLRKLLKITWQDKLPDTEVLSRADLPSIHTLLKKAQVRWAGHIVRMPNTRLPKRLFYGELTEGKRSQGGQKKRYKDTLKVSLKSFNISPNTWEIEALNRPVWRSNTSKGATSYEQNRIAEARRKRVLRKSRDNSMVADHLCPTCGRGFRARIGLISHSRTHRTRSYSTQ